MTATGDECQSSTRKKKKTLATQGRKVLIGVRAGAEGVTIPDGDRKQMRMFFDADLVIPPMRMSAEPLAQLIAARMPR